MNISAADVLRFKELDARWRGERVEGKPMGLTADEPTEHRRLSSRLAQAYVASREATLDEPVKVGFDIGGLLSKYPDLMRPIVKALSASPDVDVHIVSDMHPRQQCVTTVISNGFIVPTCNIHSCDYAAYGEECKAVKAREIGLHVLVDDFMGYVSSPGAPRLRLLVMPDASHDYYHETWKTDGTEGNFGRRRKE